MPFITLKKPFAYGRASCRDIFFAGVSADKASLGMAGGCGWRYGLRYSLGVLTTGKYIVQTTGITRERYDIPRIPH